VKPPEEELDIEMEVDNGCFQNVCVASYTLVRSDCVAAHREFIPAAISRHCALMIAVKHVINKCLPLHL
jgi:hypothetical protein